MIGIERSWFDSALHSKVTDAFLGSVSAEQNKRYMNWADRNTNAISLLNCYRPTDRDKVQGSNRVESSFWYPVDGLKGKPVFYFGGKGSGECLVVMLSCFYMYLFVLSFRSFHKSLLLFSLFSKIIIFFFFLFSISIFFLFFYLFFLFFIILLTYVFTAASLFISSSFFSSLKQYIKSWSLLYIYTQHQQKYKKSTNCKYNFFNTALRSNIALHTPQFPFLLSPFSSLAPQHQELKDLIRRYCSLHF